MKTINDDVLLSTDVDPEKEGAQNKLVKQN